MADITATYNVSIYAVVRVKVVGVEASSMEQATERAEDYADLYKLFDLTLCHKGGEEEECSLPDMHIEHCEYADDIADFLVDEQGDTEFGKSRVIPGGIYTKEVQ
jgi:hypothetical protein